MCLVNCPFGAIADKSQIYQCIQAIHSEEPVYAIVAPAIAGQFGPKCTPDKLRPLFRALGFNGVWQVSAGADICTLQEAEEFLKLVPEKQPFMGTSGKTAVHGDKLLSGMVRDGEEAGSGASGDDFHGIDADGLHGAYGQTQVRQRM